MNPEFIGNRISDMRISKNVSAREMSIAVGQSMSYINKIENKVSLPSMEMFFKICDYLDVTPREFFDEDSENPLLIRDLITQAKRLDTDSLREITNIVVTINKRS